MRLNNSCSNERHFAETIQQPTYVVGLPDGHTCRYFYAIATSRQGSCLQIVGRKVCKHNPLAVKAVDGAKMEYKTETTSINNH